MNTSYLNINSLLLKILICTKMISSFFRYHGALGLKKGAADQKYNLI